MITGYSSKPVFQYKFRPLLQDQRVMDGGFCVILYENRILSFSTYRADGSFIDELCFSLPVRVIQCFYSLLRNAGSWLGDTPCDLRGATVTTYASSFAFDGYDPIRVWGINDLLCLAENGIRLTLDGFTWDTERIHPFRKGQLYSSGRQGVI